MEYINNMDFRAIQNIGVSTYKFKHDMNDLDNWQSQRNNSLVYIPSVFHNGVDNVESGSEESQDGDDKHLDVLHHQNIINSASIIVTNERSVSPNHIMSNEFSEKTRATTNTIEYKEFGVKSSRMDVRSYLILSLFVKFYEVPY